MIELGKILIVIGFALFIYTETMDTIKEIKQECKQSVVVRTAYLNDY
jgi:hypothetical protein